MALVRAGSLFATDHYWVPGMKEWEALTTALPPSPSHGRELEITGRESNEDSWVYYSRNGENVIGPRTQKELLAMIYIGELQEMDLVFFAGSERWMSVHDLIRLLEDEVPTIRQHIAAVREALSDEEQLDMGSIIHNSLNACAINPIAGGAYIGWTAGSKILPRMIAWIKGAGN
jgi:hypothetical protein